MMTEREGVIRRGRRAVNKDHTRRREDSSSDLGAAVWVIGVSVVHRRGIEGKNKGVMGRMSGRWRGRGNRGAFVRFETGKVSHAMPDRDSARSHIPVGYVP